MDIQPQKTLEQRLTDIESKVDAVFLSSEKMRKYFLWTLVISFVVIVLPLLLLPVVIPSFLSSITIPAGF